MKSFFALVSKQGLALVQLHPALVHPNCFPFGSVSRMVMGECPPIVNAETDGAAMEKSKRAAVATTMIADFNVCRA